jgi:hypothetical protein
MSQEEQQSRDQRAVVEDVARRKGLLLDSNGNLSDNIIVFLLDDLVQDLACPLPLLLATPTTTTTTAASAASAAWKTTATAAATGVARITTTTTTTITTAAAGCTGVATTVGASTRSIPKRVLLIPLGSTLWAHFSVLIDTTE